jgi:hypothetical protein
MIEHAVVQPVAREGCAAMRAHALRDFVLVVRELQVDAAGVDVDGVAEVRPRPSPSIRCASRAGRGPRANPSPAVPGVDGFHSTKSPGSRLYGATSTRAPASISSVSRRDSAP